MAHTDRHRPQRVQLADPLEQDWYWFDQGLAFGWVRMPWYRTCGCRWCGMHFWRIEENRRRRHTEQRMARDVIKGGDWE